MVRLLLDVSPRGWAVGWGDPGPFCGKMEVVRLLLDVSLGAGESWGQALTRQARCLPAPAERNQRPREEHLQPDGPGHCTPVHHVPGQQGDQAAAEGWVGRAGQVLGAIRVGCQAWLGSVQNWGSTSYVPRGFGSLAGAGH